jgi:hypothetical protein
MVRARLQLGGNQIGCPWQRYYGSKALLRAAGVDDCSGNGATGVSAWSKGRIMQRCQQSGSPACAAHGRSGCYVALMRRP